MKRLLIVQHMAWEGPGSHLLAAIKKHRVDARVVEAWHESIPDASTFDGLLVLGGSPNVDEEDKYPYLRLLKEEIAKVIALRKGYLGFCLGHQLLGDVLGLEVGPGEQKSVGFVRGQLTEEGQAHPLSSGLTKDEYLWLFKWHAQAIQRPLPPEVVHLMSSEDCPVEAIALRDAPWVVGLQFDNHAGPQDVARWIESDRTWLHEGTQVDEAQMLRQAEELAPVIGRIFEKLFENYLALLDEAPGLLQASI